MSAFHLEIVTPTRVISEEEISYVRCPGVDGSFGVMGGHAEAMIALDVGPVKVVSSDGDRWLATSGGYADIKGDQVLLLLETAEFQDEIDAKRAKESLERAEERLKTKDMDNSRSSASLARAMNRLHVVAR